jgi:hypothetical protein
MAATRIHPERPPHPASTHKILNSPNPSDHDGVCRFPDGYEARLILLGDKISQEDFALKPKEWWPTAESSSVRNKLSQRFLSEGYLLPGLVAMSFSLLAEMYTTSPDTTGGYRARLKYESSPIVDFGIAKGRVDVKAQDRFSYFTVDDCKFMHGQNPNDHYWVYFKTIKGEEVILETGMFTFNFCLLVNNLGPYLMHGLPSIPNVPAHLVTRDFRRNAPTLHYEQERFSVLHDNGLQEAVAYSRRYLRKPDCDAICSFMERVAGRPCSDIEKHLAMTWAMDHCDILYANIASREYKKFPKEPSVGIAMDPGEMEPSESREDEAWWKYMTKWNRKQRKGLITSEQLGEAFRIWEKSPPEVRAQLSEHPSRAFKKKGHGFSRNL